MNTGTLRNKSTSIRMAVMPSTVLVPMVEPTTSSAGLTALMLSMMTTNAAAVAAKAVGRLSANLSSAKRAAAAATEMRMFIYSPSFAEKSISVALTKAGAYLPTKWDTIISQQETGATP